MARLSGHIEGCWIAMKMDLVCMVMLAGMTFINIVAISL